MKWIEIARRIETARIAIIVIAVWCLVAGLVGTLWLKSQQLPAHNACFSDKFYTFEGVILQFAHANDWKLPDWNSFTNELAKIPKLPVPECESVEAGNLPLIWNSQLTNTVFFSPDRTFILCCPPGAHGNYVGALFIENGSLSAEIIHIDKIHRHVPAGIFLGQ